MAASTRTAEHQITAREIQAGDLLSFAGVAGLDHWYDTDAPGQDVRVDAVADSDDCFDATGDENLRFFKILTIDDDTIEVRPDLHVTVLRPFPGA